MSTSLSLERAMGFEEGALVEFIGRQGARAIYVDEIDPAFGEEIEILFPRGRRFRVVAKEERAGKLYLTLELLP